MDDKVHMAFVQWVLRVQYYHGAAYHTGPNSGANSSANNHCGPNSGANYHSGTNRTCQKDLSQFLPQE